MELEILHSQAGDKKKQLDRSTPECRVEVQKFIEKQLRGGSALFLERGKKTYRITGYDAKKDKLLIRVEKRRREAVAASPDKGRKTSVPPRAGG